MICFCGHVATLHDPHLTVCNAAGCSCDFFAVPPPSSAFGPSMNTTGPLKTCYTCGLVWSFRTDEYRDGYRTYCSAKCFDARTTLAPGPADDTVFGLVRSTRFVPSRLPDYLL